MQHTQLQINVQAQPATLVSYVSNKRVPVTLKASAGRSAFQTAVAIAIAQLPDFDFFCGSPLCDEEYAGPAAIIYYTTDGVLHAVRVGRKRILQTVSAPALQ